MDIISLIMKCKDIENQMFTGSIHCELPNGYRFEITDIKFDNENQTAVIEITDDPE